MTNSELKEALLSGCPVLYDGYLSMQPHTYEYKRVSAIIYRVVNGKIDVSAELEDICGRGVSIVDPGRIRIKK